MNNPYSFAKKPQLSNRRTFSLVSKNRQPNDRPNLTTLHMGAVGLNNQFLMARRQNYLNSGYNNRRQKLQDITVQNKKIYYKLNSQKSAYSREQLRKSYQSNASISKRLSQSKVSRKLMSSRISKASLSSSQIRRDKKVTKNKRKYQIETRSIQTIKRQQLNKFQNVFKYNAQNLMPASHTQQQININKRSRKQSISSSSTQIEQRICLPSIKRPYQPRQQIMKTQIDKCNGDFLHIIAQQMFGKNTIKY